MWQIGVSLHKSPRCALKVSLCLALAQREGSPTAYCSSMSLGSDWDKGPGPWESRECGLQVCHFSCRFPVESSF